MSLQCSGIDVGRFTTTRLRSTCRRLALRGILCPADRPHILGEGLLETQSATKSNRLNLGWLAVISMIRW